MIKYFTLSIFVISISLKSFSQYSDKANNTTKANANSDKVYKIRPWVDVSAALVLDGLALGGMNIIYGRDQIPLAEVLALKKSDINRFDRPVADNYSPSAKSTSDLFFYGSMPLPLFLLLDKNIRKDGLSVGVMYLEALGATGALYSSAAMIADRYRPITYNPNVLIEIRQSGGSLNSFFAGHPALVATSTFFLAKVYSDYHPEMKHKWILYTVAGGLAATTGYLRLRAGYHFKTDVITGITIGALVGVLVPQIHKNKLMKNSKLTLVPKYQKGNTGFTAYYKLGS
jgi:membrane-associated phospholipid phosphatase